MDVSNTLDLQSVNCMVFGIDVTDNLQKKIMHSSSYELSVSCCSQSMLCFVKMQLKSCTSATT